MVSRNEYEAFLYYLVERKEGRTINWRAEVIQNYASDFSEEKSIDFTLESQRKNFAKRASRFEILESNGKHFLAKLEKADDIESQGKCVFVKRRVICTDEYDQLLRDFHDKRNYLGYLKCYYEVGSFDSLFTVQPGLY